MRLFRQHAGNVAEADDSEHLSGEAMARNRTAVAPAAAADVTIEGDDVARPPEEQREDVVGDFVPVRIAHVRDPDAARVAAATSMLSTPLPKCSDAAAARPARDHARVIGRCWLMTASARGRAPGLVFAAAIAHDEIDPGVGQAPGAAPMSV
jgi:hypothetical protein